MHAKKGGNLPKIMREICKCESCQKWMKKKVNFGPKFPKALSNAGDLAMLVEIIF